MFHSCALNKLLNYTFICDLCLKARTKRRYVLGLREVTKHLKMHKLKCIIISPNLERVQSKGRMMYQEPIYLLFSVKLFVCVNCHSCGLSIGDHHYNNGISVSHLNWWVVVVSYPRQSWLFTYCWPCVCLSVCVCLCVCNISCTKYVQKYITFFTKPEGKV